MKEERREDKSKVWKATAWTMVGSWTDNLEARIAAASDAWFETVQAKCLAEEREQEIAAAALTIEDLTAAVVELGELFAEQDDALVELAELISEEGG